jgi:hypothetical protein
MGEARPACLEMQRKGGFVFGGQLAARTVS